MSIISVIDVIVFFLFLVGIKQRFSARKLKCSLINLNSNQMLINCKADEIEKEDLLKAAEKTVIKKSEAEKCIEQVRCALSMLDDFAEEAGLLFAKSERVKAY